MALGDLYISDSDSLYRLPAAAIENGNLEDWWHYLGQRRQVRDGFDILRDGDWVASGRNPNTDVPVEYAVYTENVVGHNVGSLRGDRIHIRLGSGEPQPHQENDTAPSGIAVNSANTRYVSLYDDTGEPFIIKREANDADYTRAWSTHLAPLVGGTRRLPIDIAVRQSDGLMAAVIDNRVWIRSTHSEDDWIAHSIDIGDSTNNINLTACSWDATGRLWVWDSGHVRTMYHSRIIKDGFHSFQIGWTMPQMIGDNTVNRESVNCMAFDQRGGEWNMRIGTKAVRGLSNGSTIITGGMMQIGGHAIDIAGE